MQEYDFRPQDIRLAILANKHNHVTTIYYLLLKKDTLMGNSSIADLCSTEYEAYINNNKNLLNNYNFDINIIIRERSQKPMEKEEDIRYVPIIQNQEALTDVLMRIDDDKPSIKNVSFKNEIEIVDEYDRLQIGYLVSFEDLKSETHPKIQSKTSNKKLKEKFYFTKETQEENDLDQIPQHKEEEIKAYKEQKHTETADIVTSKKKNKFLNKLIQNRIPISGSKTNDIQRKENTDENFENRKLIHDKDLNVNVLVEGTVKDKVLLRKIYPKDKNDGNTKYNSHYNFKTNFIDTSMSYEYDERKSENSIEKKSSKRLNTFNGSSNGDSSAKKEPKRKLTDKKFITTTKTIKEETKSKEVTTLKLSQVSNTTPTKKAVNSSHLNGISQSDGKTPKTKFHKKTTSYNDVTITSLKDNLPIARPATSQVKGYSTQKKERLKDFYYSTPVETTQSNESIQYITFRYPSY